eukprot:4458554-Heterocapsa_arctica.AAC.1
MMYGMKNDEHWTTYCLKHDIASPDEGGDSGVTCGSATTDGRSALFEFLVPIASKAERHQLGVASGDASALRRQPGDTTDIDEQEYEEFC